MTSVESSCCNQLHVSSTFFFTSQFSAPPYLILHCCHFAFHLSLSLIVYSRFFRFSLRFAVPHHQPYSLFLPSASASAFCSSLLFRFQLRWPSFVRALPPRSLLFLHGLFSYFVAPCYCHTQPLIFCPSFRLQKRLGPKLSILVPLEIFID